jgi:hypothetical protein
VTQAGTDAGYSPEPGTLRAPEIAVGNVPREPGWIQGVPPLAVEYATRAKTKPSFGPREDLLRGGTKYLWVVRLAGPHRVEVYEQGKPMHVALPGEELRAPGVLRNPVRVEALYDREAAMEATLCSLLQRAGYGSLDDVRAEGKAEGLAEGEARGEAKGKVARLADAARRLLASGMTVEKTAAVLGLEVAFVQATVAEAG